MKHSVAKGASLTRGIGPSAILASALLGPLCWSAPGDLDPAFGDVGRARIDMDGPAWALELQDEEGFLVGGGDYAPAAVPLSADGFAGRIPMTGTTDPASLASGLNGIQVLDIAVQLDGKVIGVGRSVQDDQSWMTVFRLQPDGELDPAFGDAGIVRYAPDERAYGASAVALDPDGRIVVAGTRSGGLIVLPLTASGDIDASFGDAGVYVGPLVDEESRPQLLRTAVGNYRVTSNRLPVSNPKSTPLDSFIGACQVIGLTASGTLDAGFGNAGIATVATISEVGGGCKSLVEQADGKLLLAGSTAGRGFAIRLDANGVRDAGFSADAVADAMTDATAMAVRSDGSILVAGTSNGIRGAITLRLMPGGELDTLFGNAGASWVDLATYSGPVPVHDIELLSDGGALLTGGTRGTRRPLPPDFPLPSPRFGGPFVARLIGDDGRASAGVVGVMRSSIVATEQSGQAVVTVRRMGGAAGAVSIEYSTSSDDASAGDDYTSIGDQLEWADGDASDRQIVVPISAGAAPEFPEHFQVMLANPQGGVALAGRTTDVEIAADGDPGGLLGMEAVGSTILEGHAVEVTVRRDYYSLGAVSVTLTATADTASPQDFDTNPITISWADGDTEARVVSLMTTNDSNDEPPESFTLALGQPTGGAVVGPLSSVSVMIGDDDPPPESGGGGSWGLPLLLLGVTGLARGLRRKRICCLAIVACGTSIAAPALGAPTRWERAAGGNGHLYEAIRVGSPISWADARAAAKARGPGWDLATITSANEDAFVKRLFRAEPAFIREFTRCPDPDICWYRIGPWIGGFDVTDLRQFHWVTGEPVSFADWGPRSFGMWGQEIAYVEKYFWGTLAWNTPAFHPIAYIAESSEPPSVLSLTLNQAAVAGCRSVTGTVTIPQPAPPEGVVVNLSYTLGASGPATLKILAGVNRGTFTISTTPVTVRETVTASVTLGSTTLSRQLTVRPIGMLSLTLSPSTVVGGKKVIGKAKLECEAAPGPVEVTLGSSNSAIASPVAASIVVPQGVQSETFDVATNAVLDKRSVSITGTAHGIKKPRTLQVTPAASASPTSVKFGEVIVGTTSPVRNVTLYNKGVVSFSVTVIGLTGSDAPFFAQASACPAHLAAGASCTIRVTHSPKVLGARAATLSITTTATSTPLTVSVSGTGVAAP